jgi:chromosome partitioning protein
MSTIAFVNGKGGTGKTTIALGVALALAHKGYKVAWHDADGQRSLTQAFAMLERVGELGLQNLTPHTERKPVHHTIVDSPPRLDYSERQLHEALRLASVVCLPCTPAWTDLWTTADSVKHLKKLYPAAVFVIALNRVDVRTSMAQLIREKIQEEDLPAVILKTEIPQLAAYTHLPAFGFTPLPVKAREALTALALELKSFAEQPSVPAAAVAAK